jgi:DNA modification methylase
MTLNNVWFEDCISGMKNIPDNSVDLVCTDPPYFIGYAEWDKSNNFISDTKLWVSECFRVLKPQGSFWSFMGYQNVIPFISLLNEYGTVQLDNWSIWARNKGRGSKNKLKSLREDIIHVTKDSKKYTWNPIQIMREVIAPYIKDGRPRGWILDNSTGLRIRWTGAGNVFWYSAPQYNGIVEKQFHPSQKPIMLLQRLILLSSNKGDTVLDPFMGSGTTALACKTTNRNFIGFENNKEYYDHIQESLNNFDITKFKEYNLWTDKQIESYKQNNSKFSFGFM